MESSFKRQKVKRLTNGTKGAAGFTLIEVAMVALIVGLAAALAMPTGTNTDVTRVEAAAAEVAAAVRFARDESMRTGDSYGMRHQGSQNRFRVFRLDGTGTPIYDVYHPIAKQLWDIDFDVAPRFHGLVSTRTMSWRSTCNINGNIAFRSDGTPYCTDPITTLLDQGVVTLTFDNVSRDVTVDGFTGRVWMQ